MALPAILQRDPTSATYPPMFPVEIALQQHSVQTVCGAYNIDAIEWARLRQDPLFVEDLKFWVQELKKNGMSFKVKAGLMSEELLNRIWEMTHSDFEKVPAAVQADLIKSVTRFAGLDASKDQAQANAQTNALQININLGP